ncbi:hypothetical protein PoB_006732000 [Plakobranchus ocellatus]|uniref:Treble-clef zinc-finger domain-containing protein n=1 Tax=Plakobranchus ocellatus TaxID=259542 RepID=A0AAV4DA29_9GAST|nr:hypothetical protein PoB_006732000 [Plakobranchus ocellatus]
MNLPYRINLETVLDSLSASCDQSGASSKRQAMSSSSKKTPTKSSTFSDSKFPASQKAKRKRSPSPPAAATPRKQCTLCPTKRDRKIKMECSKCKSFPIVDDLTRPVWEDGINYKINLQEPFFGSLTIRFRPYAFIEEVLNGVHEYTILTIGSCTPGYSMCLMKKKESFYIFECHSKDEKGMPVPEESEDIPLIAFKTLKDLVESERKGKEQNKETPSSPAAQLSNKQKAKEFVTDTEIFGWISDSNAEDDVDYTPTKPKKPGQHKYWVQPGKEE